jgi:alkylresorcinol/alkylpyrone synthase
LLQFVSVAERNQVYRKLAPGLALEAVSGVLAPDGPEPAALVTTSCTGYHLPGWGASLVHQLGLPGDIFRLPITESGCAGGAVAIRAAAQAAVAMRGSALAVSVELCSLSLHVDDDPGNLTCAMLFGDGAGAARLETGPGTGLRILGASSMLIPGTEDLLGFELRNTGLYPILQRELPRILAPATARTVASLLARNGLRISDVSAWLFHPGGAAILQALERGLRLPEGATRWSWDSLRENGNTSSAAIFDVIRRYMGDGPRSGELAIVAAFGPGVAVELLLVQAC